MRKTFILLLSLIAFNSFAQNTKHKHSNTHKTHSSAHQKSSTKHKKSTTKHHAIKQVNNTASSHQSSTIVTPNKNREARIKGG